MAHHVQRHLGKVGAFHIDPDKVIGGAGVLGESGGDGKGQVGR